MRVQIPLETTNFSLLNINLIAFHISEDGSEIELKHCASSKTSIKSVREFRFKGSNSFIISNLSTHIQQIYDEYIRQPS